MAFALLAAALAALLAADVPQTPDGIYKRAALDLAERVPPQKRRVTRYLSLHAVPEAERAKFLQSLDFTLNSVSFRSQIVHPLILGEDRLLARLDLEALGWDGDSRALRRAEIAKRGVDTKFIRDDVWEEFVRADVFWKVTQQDGKGKLIRGWLDPVVEEATRRLSYSGSFILRADWLLPRLLTEKERGGFYSQVLMLPPKEADLYKAFLVPIETVERANQLRFGGAVPESIVAFHNRGLELIPSPYGYGPKFIWRTYDFLDDVKAEKNIFKSLAGTLKHDGREIIGSLPNGLQWYYLADGKGNQVEVVPQAIALDMRRDTPDRDRNVINAIKCISCHEAGINPYVDAVGKAILHEEIGLAVVSNDKARAAGKAYDIEDYYRIAEKGGLAADVVAHNESYARRVGAVNDLTPEDNARRTVEWYDRYVRKLVGLDQAAVEMGLSADAAKAALRASGESDLVVLSGGERISRAQWEAAFGQAMRAIVHPWETVTAKGGH